MRFIDLYEADEKKDGKNNENQLTVYKTYEDAIKNEDIVTFMKRIRRGEQGGTFKIAGIGEKAEDNKVIAFKRENRITSSDDFRKFREIFIKKYGQDKWLDDVRNKADEITANYNNKENKSWLFDVFCGLIKDDGLELTSTGKIANNADIRKKDQSTFGKESDYTKLGKAMVFYSAKFLSVAANEETDIKDPKKFAYIMQGVFGEASDSSTTENDSFLSDGDLLMKIGGIKAKMTIDAAKAVIYSKNQHHFNDQAYRRDESVEPFYYKDYLDELAVTIRLIAESEEQESGNKDKKLSMNSKYGTPATLSDFSNNPEEALHQAWDVKAAHPKEFDIEYEKLKAAFDKGLKEYQEELRKPEFVKDGVIQNPITGKMEKIKHSGFGTGGPNGFIRKNERLKKLCDDIKGQDWNIFNTGPKLLLKLFDAIEAGGDILQKLCDDISKSWKGLKDLMAKLDPREVQRRIDKLIKDNNQTGAMEDMICNSLLGLYGVYVWINNPHITIYSTQHAMSTMDESDKTPSDPLLKKNAQIFIQIVNDNMEKTITAYTKWKEMTDKRNSNIKANQKDKKPEEKKQEEQKPENASYKPAKRSFVSFLTEDDAPEAEGVNKAAEDAEAKKQSDASNKPEDKTGDKKEFTPQEEKIIPTTLKLNVLNTIKSDFGNASSDIQKKASNIANLLAELNDFESDSGKIEEYVNDDFSNKEKLADQTAANASDATSTEETSNVQDSFELEPIDLSKFLTEGLDDTDSDDDVETPVNATGSNSAPAPQNTKPEEQKSTEAPKSDIEKIATFSDEGKNAINALVEAMKSIAGANPFTVDMINQIIKDCSDEKTVLQGIDKFKKAVSDITSAIEPATKVAKVENQVVNIDKDSENEREAQCKEANIRMIKKNVTAAGGEKKEDENKEELTGIAKSMSDFYTSVTKIRTDIIKNVIVPIRSSLKVVADANTEDSKPEAKEEAGQVTGSLYGKISSALKSSCEELQKTIIGFLDANKADAAKKSYEPLFAYLNNEKLLPAPKTVYAMNVANIALSSIPSIYKANKANIAPNEKETIENVIKQINIPKVDNINGAKEIEDGSASIEQLKNAYNIDIKSGDQAKANTGKIQHTIATIVKLTGKVLMGYHAMFPDNVNDPIYWALANQKSKDLEKIFADLQRSVGDTSNGLTANKGSSFIFGLRALDGFAKEHQNDEQFKNLVQIVNDCQKDFDMLIELSKSRTEWNLLAYLSIADSIMKRIAAADLSDAEYKVILDGNKAGQQDTAQNKPEAGAEGRTAQAVNGQNETSGANPNNNQQAATKSDSYIPEFSPDMLINEIYKYIRGN